MVKSFAATIVLCLAFCVNAGEAGTTIESAFHSFYGEPIRFVTRDKEVKLLVNAIEEDASLIPVRMKFDLAAVEKVLLLKLKNTGYTNIGYFNPACAAEPVFVAAYTLDAGKNISELETRIHTHCSADTITLLLWAKTRDGHYYSNTVTFKTTTESPG